MKRRWAAAFAYDPLPALLSSGCDALTGFVRRDLLDEKARSAAQPWETAESRALIRKQQPDGSWRYHGKRSSGLDYDLLETYRTLGILVEKYGMTMAHPGLARAADFVFSRQTSEGDIRGILGTQYMPYYCGGLVELLIKAGYSPDPRIGRAMRWLLSVRQDDGGWVVPMQTVPHRSSKFWSSEPVRADPTLPSSHLATGMVIRAFAVHPRFRKAPEARLAAELLKSRLFKADRYYDRKAPTYWKKLKYPFWWTSLLTALDSLSLLGFSRDDPEVARGLDWFVENQEEDGLWETGYGLAKDRDLRLWVCLAVCRVFKRFHSRSRRQ